MDKPGKDGSTLRAHLEQASISGIIDERLQTETVPDISERIWKAYWRIRGQAPITATDILAYQKLMCVKFFPWEIDALWKIDDAVQEALFKEDKTVGPGKTRNSN